MIRITDNKSSTDYLNQIISPDNISLREKAITKVELASELKAKSFFLVLNGAIENLLPLDLQNIAVPLESLPNEKRKAWTPLREGDSMIIVGEPPSYQQIQDLKQISGLKAAFQRGMDIYYGGNLLSGKISLDYTETDNLLLDLGLLDKPYEKDSTHNRRK